MNIYISYLLIYISNCCFWFVNLTLCWIRLFKMSILINLTYWVVALWYYLICLTIFFDCIGFFTWFSCIIWCVIWRFWCILFWLFNFITLFIYICDYNFTLFRFFFKLINISYILVLFSYFSSRRV